MKKYQYDRCLPLGDRCTCTNIVRKYGLRPRGCKYPFDWVKGGDLESRTYTLLTDFNDFLVPHRLKKLKYLRPEQLGYNRYYDTKTCLVFAHDFPKELPFSDGLYVAMKTFAPKIARLRADFAAHRRILMVYTTACPIAVRQLRDTVQKLRQHFGYNGIDLLVIENGIKTIWKYNFRRIGHGIWRARTKLDLMPLHFEDLGPAEFKILDKIFAHFQLKPDAAQEFTTETNAINDDTDNVSCATPNI